MSFTAANLLDYYKASMAGKVTPNMQYVSQRGRGMGNKRRRLIYNINQKGGGGTNLVSPIAQDFQQAKSMIKQRNSIKRARSRSTSSHPKRRRTVRKSSKKSPKKKTSTRKKKTTKGRGTKKTKVIKKKASKKTGRKKTTRKDIFGK